MKKEISNQVEGIYSLTSMQEGMLFYKNLDEKSTSYVIQSVLFVAGNLDYEKLNEAISLLAVKHDALRATFLYKKVVKPRFVILAERNLETQFIDLSIEIEKETKFEEIKEADITRGFDLSVDSLMRVTVVKMEENTFKMLWCFHHIIMDGWCFSIILKDFMCFYDKLRNGVTKGKLVEEIKGDNSSTQSYAKYLKWHSGQDKEEGLAYWDSYLKDYHSDVDIIPLGIAKNTEEQVMSQNFYVRQELCEHIQKISKEQKITISTYLEATWGILLQKYNRIDDVVFGKVVSGRNADIRNINEIVGLFINTIPVRAKVNEETTIKELLDNMMYDSIESTSYIYNSLADIQDCTDLGKNFIKTLFVFENYYVDTEAYHNGIEGFDIKMESAREQTNYGISFKASFTNDGFMNTQDNALELSIMYKPSLYCEKEINLLLQRFEKILSYVLTEQDHRIQDIELITREELHCILNTFNATQKTYPTDLCVQELFEHEAVKNPLNIAASFKNQIITYEQLNKKANQMARKLMALGVKNNDNVVILAERSIQLLIGIYAVMKSGATYIPVDPKYPKDRIEFIIEDSKPTAILICMESEIQRTNVPIIPLYDDKQYNGDSSNLSRMNSPDDPIYIIYTSGTSGQPKGVVVSHTSVVNHLFIVKERFYKGKVGVTPLFTNPVFDLSVPSILAPLSFGSKCYIYETAEQGIEEIFTNDEIVLVKLTPSLLKALCQNNRLKAPKNLRCIVLGGEKLESKVVDVAYERLGNKIEIYNEYGPTEATVFTTSNLIEKEHGSIIPIGFVEDNMSIYILDGVKQCGIGMIGELCIGGVGLAKGYLNNDALTQEKFIDNPYAEGKVYRSGDLARWLPDGNLDFIGRVDEQVKIRGFRVETSEVERVICSVAGVSDAVVITRDDDSGENNLFAYIVPTSEIELEQVRLALQAELPEYMVPNYMMIIEQIPITTNGKLDKRKLPMIYEKSKVEYVAARNETEEKLCMIFEKVLNRNTVSITDNFFEIGGHSLRAMRVINLIDIEIGYKIPLKYFFDNPTILAISQEIVNNDKTQHTFIQKASIQEAYAMSSSQKRMYFAYQMEPTSISYNMPYLLKVKESVLDIDKIKEAYTNLLIRHEILRTKFCMIDGNMKQTIESNPVVDVEYIETKSCIEELSSRLVYPFVLDKLPLIRMKIVESKEGQYIFIDMHHIVSDGVSQTIFIDELLKSYNSIELPNNELQYKDYSEWLRTQDLSKQKEYWIKEFHENIPILDFPYDFPRPIKLSQKGRLVTTTFGEDIKKEIALIGKKTGTTEYMIFLTAVMILIGKYSRQDDIIVGSPISGRTTKDLESMMGVFINTLALRAKPKKESTVLELLNSVKDKTLKAYENQIYPFEQLVEELDIHTDLSRNPLFDVMFVYQNYDKVQLTSKNLTLEHCEPNYENEKFDFTIHVDVLENSYYAGISYSTDLFHESSIQTMLSHFKMVLLNMINNINQKIEQINMMTSDEEELVISKFNQTTVEYPDSKTVIQMFEEQVLANPKGIVLEDEGCKLTYEELNVYANHTAMELQNYGVGIEDKVAILAEKRIELIIDIVAVLKVGAAYVPIDIQYPNERKRFMIDDCEPKAILLTNKEQYADLCLEEVTEPILYPDCYGSEVQSIDNIKCSVSKDNLAYIIYTSGTTGKPKGVMIEHQSLTNYITYAKEAYVDHRICMPLFTNPSFDLTVTSIFLPLCFGGKLVVYNNTIDVDIDKIFRNQELTIIKLTPIHLKEAVALTQTEKLNNLQSLILGGEELVTDVAQMCLEQFGEHIKIHNEYGPTESTVGCCDYIYTKDITTRTVSIGKPIANTQIRILDGILPCGFGVPGELCISGVGLARGYLNQPVLTVEKFQDSLIDTMRLYRTGDLARWSSDGNIEYLGRIDEQVKIRGFRVELGEVAANIKNIDGISDVAVIANDDNGTKYLAAYLVANEPIDLEDIRGKLSKELPNYMIPARFAQIKEIPVNSNGKLNKRALPSIDIVSTNHYVAPKNQLESVLCEIFETILHVDKIGIEDNFFELGGHSLSATKLVNQMEAKLSIRVPLKDIFVARCVKNIAILVNNQHNTKQESIPVANKQQAYLMSSAQRRIFLLNQLNEKNTVYNIQDTIVFHGDFNHDCAKEALKEITNRHETLRTRFKIIGGEPVQLIEEEAKIQYSIIEDTDTDIKQLQADFNQPFNLEEAPLLRVCTVNRGDKTFLIFNTHHIISDGVSIEILKEEFIHLYNGDKLETVTLHYKDYSEWLRTRDLSSEQEYWLNQFENDTPVLNLPLDFIRPATQSFEGAALQAYIEPELTAMMKELALKTGTTDYMVLLSVTMILLSKYSRQKDIVVGSPISGRNHHDTEKMLGMFVNTLALRGCVEKTKSYNDFLAEIKETCLAAYDNQEYPFEELVEEVCVNRDMSRNPLFDIMFAVQNNAVYDDMFCQKDLQTIQKLDHEVSKFDISISVGECRNGYVMLVEYCTALFKEDTIIYIIQHFKHVLYEVLTNPDIELGSIGTANFQERQIILNEFNNTAKEYPRDMSVIELFEKNVEKAPDQVAITFENESITYKELNERVNSLAYRLRKLGVRPDEFVAIIAERSIEMVEGILAIIKAGAAYVAIDSTYPKQRIDYMLQDSSAKMVLTYQVELETELLVIDLEEQELWVGPYDNLSIVNKPTDLMYLIYTSGTSGNPKGVMIEHQGVISMGTYLNDLYAMTEQDVVLQFANTIFDASVWELTISLLLGATLCLIPKEIITDLVSFKNYVEEHKVTVTLLPPQFCAQIKIDGLRVLTTGGSAANPEIIDAYKNKVRFINAYGPTENTVLATHWEYEKEMSIPHNIPIGKPISNSKLYIVEEDILCGVGIPGELCITGDGLARGYLNLPELTNNKFCNNLFGDGKMYRSGDLARWLPDGNIEYLGRIDEQVKIRGFRIELGEIESVIRKIEYIQDLVLLTKVDASGDNVIYAYLVSNTEVDIDEIKNTMRKTLPDYMIPAFMMQIDAIPVTRSGKTDKEKLPNIEITRLDTEFIPRNKYEELVCSAFKEILCLNTVGIRDNFFELGGHSLKATKLVNNLEEKTGIRLRLKDLFINTTPELIARLLETCLKDTYERIPIASDKEYYDMSSAQKRMYMASQVDDTKVAYNISGILRISGDFVKERFKQAVEQLTIRHDALRTSFAVVEGSLVQIIHNEPVLDIEYADIKKVDVQESTIAELYHNFVRPFDLHKAPLIRFKAVTTGMDNTEVFIDIHHSIADGMSMGIIQRELIQLYEGESLENIPIQYKDYSEWMLTRDLSSQKSYWMNQYADDLPVLDIPLDYPRPFTQSFRGNSIKYRISSDVKSQIKKLIKQTNTTEYMVLFSGLSILLSKYSRQQDIIIGSPVAGRTHKDTENIVGMFVNTLAIRTQPNPEKEYLSYLEEVKTTCLNAFENQEYPFDSLIEDLDVKREISRNPLFDIMFVLQNNESVNQEYESLLKDDVKVDDTHKESKFDLTVIVLHKNDEYELIFEYCSDLFKQESIMNLIKQYIHILRELSQSPQLCIGEIEEITEEEKLCIQTFNNRRDVLNHNITVPDLLKEQARLHARQCAVVYQDKQITYQDLDYYSDMLATKLRALGVQNNESVALLTEKSIEMVIGICAVLKAGGAYVPIDTRYPEERINYILNDCNPKVVLIYDQEYTGMVPVIDLKSSSTWIGETKKSNQTILSNDLAYIIYTSGTTGNPKGTMIAHKSIIHLVNQPSFIQLDENSVILQTGAMAFDASTFEVWGALLNGGKLILADMDVIMKPESLHRMITQNNVNIMWLTSTLFNQMVELDCTVFDSLTYLLIGGEKLSERHVKQFKRHNQSTILINGYGPTENTTFTTTYKIPTTFERIPIGLPINDTKVYILNNSDKLCGIGVPGELCAAGAGVARGYLNMPELTQDKFIPNMFGEEVLYRTGDLARWLPDGNIEYLGRLDEQIKIRGFRVELTEIETVINGLEYVSESAVTVREDSKGDKRIYAYIVSNGMEDSYQLKEELRTKLPDYMIPSYITYLEQLPTTKNGKLDRKALEVVEVYSVKEYMEPITETEKKVAHTFSNVLNINKVSRLDDFFELGGHSLRAIRVINELEQLMNVRITLKDVFQHSTVKLLADFMDGIQVDNYQAIPTSEEKEQYIMSSAQKRMYMIHQINTKSLSYNMPYIMKVTTGKIDAQKLKLALQRLIQRHEILRTVFIMKKGQLCQETKTEEIVEFTEVTCNTDLKDSIQNFVRPFVLEQLPLIRMQVVTIQLEQYIMLDMHHIISDGMSAGILFDELFALYEGKELAPLRVQYKDYSEWMNGRDLAMQRNYWKDIFSDEIPVLDFPLDYQRPQIQTFSGKETRLKLGKEVREKIVELCKNTNTTEYMVLLACFTLLLSKYSRQEDIVVGSPIAGRTHKDTENMLGMFVNTIALRTKPEKEKRFLDYLKELKEIVLAANENQEYPFEELVEELNIQRDISRNPLFDVMFVYQNNEELKLSTEEFCLAGCESEINIEKFDITFCVSPTKEGYNIVLNYSTDIFKKVSMEQLLLHYQTILTNALTNYNSKLEEISPVDAREKVKITKVFNENTTKYPKDKSVGELFEEQVKRTPNAVALVSGNAVLTYNQVNLRANKLAMMLVQKGVVANDFVAIGVERTIDTIIGILGIVKAGAAYVPIDFNYPADRVQFMLEDCTPKFFIQVNEINTIKIDIPIIRLHEIDLYPEAEYVNYNKSNDLIYLIYTSGTTGNPKGVMISHQNVVRLIKNTNYIELTEKNRILQTGSLAFDASTFEIWGVLLNGGMLDIVSNDIITNDKLLVDEINNKEINTMWVTASLYNQMISTNACIFDGLNYLLIGGEKLSEKHVNILKKRNKKIHLINGYGPTENTTFTTTYEITDCMDKIPIGKPIANTQVYVIENKELCGIGIPGELCTTGDGLSIGYLNNEELTSQKYEPNRFGDGLMYHTGDLVRWLPDGNIEYLGRIDEQVKIRGFRIELSEIETVIRREENVEDVAIIVRTLENQEKVICAYVVMMSKLDVQDMKGKLRKILPEYMIPMQIVQLEELPLTINGKLDRRRLPEIEFCKDKTYVKPRTELERIIASIFMEILSLKDVGVYDNFFELGGHSLRATRMINAIEEATGIHLTLKDIFENATIDSIAELVKAGKGEYEQLQRAIIKEYYPMSSLQRRIYLVSNISPNSLVYNMPRFLTISGVFDVLRIKDALEDMIARHEILRTSFQMINGELMQKVHEQGTLVFTYQELSEEENENRLKNFVQPFALGKESLLRVEINKVDNIYYLLFDMHHIISDGMSMNIFWKELFQSYVGETVEQGAYQYKDYSEWVQKRDLQNQKEYWISELRDNLTELNLPYDYPRTRIQSSTGARTAINFSAELKQSLDEFCSNNNVTSYMVMLSAIMITISTFSGQESLLLGTVMSGRTHKETEKMLGMFVNTVVMHGEPELEIPYIEFLHTIRSKALKAFENQEYPFDSLLEDLDIKREVSRNPIFDVMFVMQNNEKLDLTVEGLEIVDIPTNYSDEKFDLTFTASETNDSCTIDLGYRSDLFKETTITIMLDRLHTILTKILANPLQLIQDIKKISDKEEQLICNVFNDTRTAYPVDKSVDDILEEMVKLYPDSVAVISGDIQLTYEELDTKSNSLANQLIQMGVVSNDLVAIFARKSIETIIAICAIIKLGAAYVPIDTRYPMQRVQSILQDCNPKVIMKYKTDIVTNIPILDLLDESYLSNSIELKQRSAQPNNLLYVIYTSGTTGRPKGVMVEHKSAVRLVKNTNYVTLNHDTVILQTGDMAFDASTFEVWGALLNGGTLVLVPTEVFAKDDVLKSTIIKYGVNTMWLTAMLFNQVVEIDLHVLDSLQYLLIGGEKLSEKHVKIFKENNNYTNLINGYGPTENTTFTTTYLIPDQFERITIGTPIANTQVYIVDTNRKLCGINEPGELCTTGDGLALGYLNHEELTKEVFIQNPFGEGKMYCTGDLAKWLPDGTIDFLGRMDQQVKIRGFRIELAEIETVINNISGISDCAVIIKEDSMGDKRICAFIVKNDKNLEIPVKENLKNILPEYMIPTYISEVEVLPLNQNGKLDVKALLEIPIDINNEYREPATDVEKSLVAIWGKVLQVSKIGISDNFFENGGHSLKAMKVINKIAEELGIRLELRDIFEYATVEELATYISNKNNVMEEIAVAKEEQREYYPMSSAQKRIFVVSQLDSTHTAYNMPQVYEVVGKLDIIRLQSAFHELTNRHEVCKTRFYMLENEAVQEVDCNIECEFTCEVVEDFNVEELLKRFVRPFVFAEGGLIRLKIVQYKEQYYLFLDVHHIISDGMSMSIIFKELSDLYSKKTLPKLNIQYKDYCIWLQQCNIEKQKGYWLKEFEGDIPIVELPYDYKRGEIQSFRGNILNRVIDSDTRQRLIEFSKKSQTTEFMIFTSAIMIALGKYSNQEDIIIGSPVYGRTNSEVENLVGVFVNTLALRGDINGEKSYLDFLKEIKETALRAYENQEYQFDDLIDTLEIKRDISRNPLFDVMFSYQNNDSVELNIDNVFIKPVEHKFESQKFDLTFYISDSESDVYDLSVGYCTDLFMEKTVQKIMDSFLDVIQSILLDENQKIKEIDIIKAEERDKVLHQFNSQSMSCSDSCTICDMFMKQANLTPNAVVSVYKNTKITYAQLRESANQLANYLRNQGVQREDVIGIMMEQSNDILVGILGILFSGAAYLPIDPSYPKDRIEYMLQDSGAKILVTQEHLVGTIDYTGKSVCINDELFEESKNIQIINQPSDLAYVIYTSGSTGRPKGVMIEHHNIVNLVNWHNRVYEVTSDDCSTKYAGFGFDASVWEIFPYIVVGAQIHVIDSDLRMNIQGLNQYFEENNISISFLPTQICEQFITLPNKSLRTLLTGGDKLRKYVPTNYRLVNNYGPTENTVVSTNYWVNAENKNIPIGKPIDNVRAYVIDKYHSLVPIGICGELAVSGENLARGYLHNDELTKEKFIENPFEPGNKMYLTGDIVRWREDGNIEYIGREDNQVKIRGNRVEIGEIEQAALQHVEISECVAMIWEANSGDKRIVLYYVASKELDSKEIKSFLATFLPSYMLPTIYYPLSELPLTANGKINKEKLPSLQELYKEKPEQPVVEMTTVIKNIHEIWKTVLEIGDISIYDNFFEIGGNSILLIGMHNKLEEIYPGAISIAEIFANPSIIKLAETIEYKSNKILLKGIVLQDTSFRTDVQDISNGKLQYQYTEEATNSILNEVEDVIELKNILITVFAFVLKQNSIEEHIVLHCQEEVGKYYTLDIDLKNQTNLNSMLLNVLEVKKSSQQITYTLESATKNYDQNTSVTVLLKFNTNTCIDEKNLYDIILSVDISKKIVLEFSSNNVQIDMDFMGNMFNQLISTSSVIFNY